jgi:Transposase DDE domain group 1
MGEDLNQEGKSMISQGILRFKIEHTEEQITPRSGLALFAEVIRALDVRRKVEGHFPKPGSNRGYEAWSYIEPVLLMLEGGGRHIEDLREIRDDAALRQLGGIGEMPSLSTYGDWLVRMGSGGGVAAIRAVNDEVAETIHRRTGTSDYTLDVDATVIEAEKQEAEWTYKKVRGYQPMLGFLAETGLCLTHEFRKGNRPAQHGAVRFLKRCLKLCPKIRRLRSDSAFYQADVLAWCEEHDLGYTITADQDPAIKEVIKTVRDWTTLRDKDGKPTDREVGTAIHAMAKKGEPFRLVIQRWRDPQLPLFQKPEYCYYVIATNRDDRSPEEVIRFHNERGQAENEIKELKIGFGMEQMTSGDYRANAVWFGFGVLTYNLTLAEKLLFLDAEWKTKTVATLRWQLIETAGRLVRHGRRLVLRLAASWEKFQLYLRIRARLAAFL